MQRPGFYVAPPRLGQAAREVSRLQAAGSENHLQFQHPIHPQAAFDQ